MLAAASVSVLKQSAPMRSGNISQDLSQRVEAWVEAAAASSPDSPVCLIALADLRLWQQRLSEAEALYLKVLTHNDRNVAGLNNLAWLSAFLHDNPPDALRRINRAIQVAGPRPDLLDTRAVIYILADQSTEAIRDLNAALHESPSAIGYVHLAEAKMLTGDWEAVRQNLRLAEQMQFSSERLHPLEKQFFEKLMKRMPENFTSGVDIESAPGSRP
jgi:tetratricopeptide (TPR) repeat protein